MGQTSHASEQKSGKFMVKCIPLRSCVDRPHISVPGLRSKEVSSFLKSLGRGGEDVFVSRDLQRAFLPQTALTRTNTEEKLEGPKNALPVKEELDDDDGEGDEYEDVKENFDEESDDRKDVDMDFEEQEDKMASPISSDVEDFNEDENSSEDSDYEEEPSQRRKKTRKYNLSNLRQFRGKTENELKNISLNKKQKSEQRRRKFGCTICEKWFRKESVLLNHVTKKHGPAPPPQCDICLATFESHKKRQYHRKVEHSEMVPCEECGRNYPMSIMTEHMKNVHDNCEPRTCEHCGAVFTNKRKFGLHVRSHTNPKVTKANARDAWMVKIKENCKCQMEFTTKRSHIEHYKIVHENYQECSKCKKLVKNLDERRHRCEKPKPATPKKGHTCEECGKFVENYASMWYHMNAFHSKTSESCEICGKIFKSRTHLKSHLKNFHAEKSTCVVCGIQVHGSDHDIGDDDRDGNDNVINDDNMTTVTTMPTMTMGMTMRMMVQVKDLKEHMGTMHTAEQDKPFKCDQCGKGFTSNYLLRNHMNIHLNIKPYVCR